jgi:two-component system, chemotaxis family, protein-glutamate methylesterase/glutaminase
VTAVPSLADGAVTVLVVADCPRTRRDLRAACHGEEDLHVVGEVEVTPEAAPAAVERLRPSVVVLDLAPGSDGVRAVEQILALAPTPVLVCSDGADSRATVAALAAGAVGVLPRPGGPAPHSGAELRRRLRTASRLAVLPRLPAPGRLPAGPPDRVPTADARGASAPQRPCVRVVAIGASTGGPSALAAVLGALPASLAGRESPAFVVVQHMAVGFLPGLAQWLDGVCALPVGVARSGERLAPGAVVFAPGGGNLLVDSRLRAVVEPPPAGQLHVPGIDVTFTSVARSVGAAALGVLLTGMGRDGADGLCALRDAGALTLGQDEGSCAVYGMPGAARRAGGVREELPLAEIGPRLVAELQRGTGGPQ